MNSIDNNGNSDQSLDQDLQDLDRKYQSIESDEPPEMLDQAILNRAHRAVEAKNSWLDFGWIHGLTTMALVVLTFSVVLSLRDTAEFDPTMAPASDKPMMPPNRKKMNQATQEAKAKNDADSPTAAGHLALEEVIVTSSDDASKELPESSYSRLERQRQATADQGQSDDAAAYLAEPRQAPQAAPSAALKAPAAQEREEQAAQERDIQTHTGLQPDLEVAAPISENEIDLSDVDALGKLELSQQAELLDNIIELKLAGNEDWQEQLAAFIKAYPDYPLPDELKP